MRRRVAVTGMGVICPLGGTVNGIWERALAGESAISSLTLVNSANGAQVTVPAGRVPDSALKALPKSVEMMTDKFGRFAVMAASDAIFHSMLDLEEENCSRIGVSTGSCMNGITETEVGFESLFVRKRSRVHPFTLVRTMPNSPAAFIAMNYAFAGPVLHYSTTCSSSSVAIGEASRQIRHGYADVMIAGGTETLLTYAAVNCWQSAQLLAPLHNDPAQSCRPFDATRNGAVLGEGAAFVVLEEWNHAVARGAPIRAELVGYACTADSAHLTQPSTTGQAAAMRAALEDAGITSAEVGYINAHGTATRLNDAAETLAIKAVFGENANRIAISSSKSMVGHMVGAAGAFSIFMCIKSIETGHVPPTVNLRTRDPICDLDYVPNIGRRAQGLNSAMANAFGFGGTAACVVLNSPR